VMRPRRATDVGCILPRLGGLVWEEREKAGEERMLNKAQLDGSRRQKEQARRLAAVVRQSRSPDVRRMS
jgi:hypothetical protein